MAESDGGSAATNQNHAGPVVYTLAELKNHDSMESCWLTIHGKVYDVTKFLEDHPGGVEVLLASTGTDATKDFEDVGHSQSARELLQEYFIGELNPADLVKTTQQGGAVPAAAAVDGNAAPRGQTSLFTRILQFLVPLGILGLAVAVRVFTANELPASS
ncbi:hypothetical protein CBR_g29425 [Chara braunii]|uniref:Cytochrome b5 heme-binding domain-containing protein n=1 Tax=Chara braunii TaxID=69332 RepID=A0A388LAC7_CHABU|nr:hypothetical protein CBR_g29425 [Chara braunii]|eukprot:GBG79275.1 hypothetical protein CBR_g29425 [Chara braunii]